MLRSATLLFLAASASEVVLLGEASQRDSATSIATSVHAKAAIERGHLWRHGLSATTLPPLQQIGGLICESQDQLFQSLNDMKGICCDQLGESSIPWGNNPFPITCIALECKRVVLQVWSACTALLNSSGFFDEWRVQLQQTVQLCQQEAPPPPSSAMEYVLIEPTGRTAPQDSCQNTSSLRPRTVVGYPMPQLDGGPSPAPATPVVDLRAPPGFVITIRFNALWLPPGVSLEVFEGTADSIGREIVSLSGTNKPAQPISSTTSNMHVTLQSTGLGAGTPRLISLAAELGCRCVEAGSCGPHGSCNSWFGCICSGGFLGVRCDDASCAPSVNRSILSAIILSSQLIELINARCITIVYPQVLAYSVGPTEHVQLVDYLVFLATVFATRDIQETDATC